MIAVKTAAQDQDSQVLARAMSLKVLSYCRENDWAGYDPYDALNSRLLTLCPALDRRVPRLILTQSLKRSPLNLRALALIPKTQNPKGLALCLAALLRLDKTDCHDRDDLVEALVRRLIALRSPDTAYWCWGYSFPWQTRTALVPRWTPNLVCTSFVANALLDAFEASQDARCLSMAVSSAEFILNDLYWTAGSSESGFAYPMRSDRSHIHNANFLGAAFLARVARLAGRTTFIEPALSAARCSAAQQHADGSWDYGVSAHQRWIDNFHTGYNLCALDGIARAARTSEFDPAIRRGLTFYRDHFFREDGAARYFHDRTYPIDVHCVAQALITMVSLRHVDVDNMRLARAVFRWAAGHLWDRRGYFYYRALRFCTIRTPYMRWSQAWMLLALAMFSSADRAAEATEPPPQAEAAA